jgi:predicted AAA+ superfamily ATPase
MVPRPSLYYWRTGSGAEVDFVIEHSQRLIPIEVKSAIQVKPTTIRGLKSFSESQKKCKYLFIMYYIGEKRLLSWINQL